MAPDVNSLPTSPRPEGGRSQPPATAPAPSLPTSTAASRRTSQIMPPPQHPASASSTTHHSTHTSAPPSSSRSAHPSPAMSGSEFPGVPMRHPRPLTAAELYMEVEKEQEAVVNRLTRELTALRAQTASVASNASSISSTSAGPSILPVDISDPNPTHQITGATHPTPSRRHRSSSSLSASSRGIPTPSTSTASGITNISTQGHAGSTAIPSSGVSQASAERAAAAGDRTSLSRNPSVSASGRSTPARQSTDFSRLPHRPSLSRDPSATTVSSMQAQAGTPVPTGPHPLPTPSQSPASHHIGVPLAMQHFADANAYRAEIEALKADNERLKQQVRNLEREVRQEARRRGSSQSDTARPVLANSSGSRENLFRPQESERERNSRESTRIPSFTSPPHSAGLGVWSSDGGIGGVAGPRERSESQSTTASSRRGVTSTEEDSIRVGESANSTGVGRPL